MRLRFRLILEALLVSAAGALVLAGPAAAAHKTFGSSLSATPTLDTANSDRSNHGSTAGPVPAVLPNPHEAEDTGLWNASGSRAANGQALFIKVKGCAIKDTSAPTGAGGRQLSVGTPVNTILFQTLAPHGGAYTSTATSGSFLMPFCTSSAHAASGAVNTGTVTRFQPVHMCLAAGDVVAFHDIGGFIPSQAGRGPWYPQGVPFTVIARAAGSTMNSFTGVGAAAYGPGRWGSPEPNRSASGFASEPGEQVLLQVVEGTGGDAYGLCPGGTAVEPNNSNRVICDAGKVTRGHRRCSGTSADAALTDAVQRFARVRLRIRAF